MILSNWNITVIQGRARTSGMDAEWHANQTMLMEAEQHRERRECRQSNAEVLFFPLLNNTSQRVVPASSRKDAIFVADSPCLGVPNCIREYYVYECEYSMQASLF